MKVIGHECHEGFMMTIENNKECFVHLWRLLEHTRKYLDAHYKRFCVRHVLRLWFKGDAFALSASAPRTAAGYRGGKVGYRDAEG